MSESRNTKVTVECVNCKARQEIEFGGELSCKYCLCPTIPVSVEVRKPKFRWKKYQGGRANV